MPDWTVFFPLKFTALFKYRDVVLVRFLCCTDPYVVLIPSFSPATQSHPMISCTPISLKSDPQSRSINFAVSDLTTLR